MRQTRRGFGLARARNAGAKAAAAHDILVFLDGDVIAEAGLIRAHARWHHAVGDALTQGFCAYVSAARSIARPRSAAAAARWRTLFAGTGPATRRGSSVTWPARAISPPATPTFSEP